MMNNTTDSLVLSENSLSYLSSTQKWAKFLAILSFIGMGLLFVIAIGLIVSNFIFASEIGSSFPFLFMGIFYLVLMGIMIIPTVYLFKFATNTEKLVKYRDNIKAEEAFRYLRAYYRFIGIFTIVTLSIYLLIFLITIFVGIGAFAFLS